MSELSPEEERARKLEEAKKRVEELKKKNKNKKNKKKKDKEDLEATEVKTETETELEPTDTNISESPVNSDEQPIVEETKIEEKAGINTDVKGNENNEEKSEKEPEEQSEQESVENQEVSEEEFPGKKATDVPKPTDEVSEGASVVQQKEEEQIEAKKTDEVEELFGGNDDKEKDFLSTIQEQKSQEEVMNLKEEVSKLKDQVKQLKFVNIDQESSIEELEEQKNILKSQLNDKIAQLVSVQQELSTCRQEIEQLRAMQLSQPTPVEFSSFDRHSPSKFEPSRQIQHPTTDPAMLAKWKNWNVDMTNWRSIGVGPVVEF